MVGRGGFKPSLGARELVAAEIFGLAEFTVMESGAGIRIQNLVRIVYGSVFTKYWKNSKRRKSRKK